MIQERCCRPCRYRPATIRKTLAFVALFTAAGEDPTAEIGSCMVPWRGYEVGGGAVFGPKDPAAFSGYLADLERAARAVGSDPDTMSAYLCPWACVDDDAARSLE